MWPVREVEPSGSSDLSSPLIKTTDLYMHRERKSVRETVLKGMAVPTCSSHFTSQRLIETV